MLFVFVWLSSLTMIICRSIHVAANDIISFLFIAEYYSIIYVYHIFICSSVDGHLLCSCVLTIINSSSRNIGVLVYFQIRIFSRYWVIQKVH